MDRDIEELMQRVAEAKKESLFAVSTQPELDVKELLHRLADAKKACLFLDTAQAAFVVLFSKSGLEKRRKRRVGPPWRYHGRKVVYHVDDLMAWSLERIALGNADAPGPS